jgi:hypothetical protein
MPTSDGKMKFDDVGDNEEESFENYERIHR